MKTPLAFLMLFLPLLSFGQAPEKHAQVNLQIDRSDFIHYLNDKGFEIDHFHKHGKNEMEVVITHTELALLSGLGIKHEVVILDVAAHFQELVDYSANSRDVTCGLTNFDNGNMGDYHTYDDMQVHINNMQSQFPDLVQISEIGTSVEGRTIFAVKISDNVSTDESDVEGVVYYDALTHAREPMGLETVLYYMWGLLENYTTDPEATYLVNNREMYFVPVVNPDGYVYNQSTNPNGGGLWRKNRRDNGGGCFGIDLNRNYSFEWGNLAGSSNDPCSGLYHGTAAFSEPETQTIRDFTELIEPAAAFSCHTYSDVFLCPNGYNDDLVRYETYAEFASEFIPEGYKGYGNWIQMIGYYGAGTTHDFLNSVGTIAYTPEIGHSFWEPPSVICDRIQEMLPAMKYMSWVAGDYTCFHDFELMDPGIIWPTYTSALTVRVKNRGLSKTAQNVMVEISTTHPAVSFLNNSVTMDDILPRQFADNSSNPFLFTVDDSVFLGEEIALNVTVYQGAAITYEDVIYLYAGETDALLEENGENGISQWLTSGTTPWDTTFMDSFNGNHSVTDTRYGNFEANGNSNIQLAEGIDLSNTSAPWLEFNAKWSFEPNEDYAQLKVSANNGPWIAFASQFTSPLFSGPSYTNNKHWVQERIDLSAYAGEQNVKIGFFITTDNGVQSDGFYFDDLKVVDYMEPELVGIGETGKYNYEVFPNPTNDHLTINFGPGGESNYEIELLDMQGRLLYKEQFIGNAGLVSLSDFPNGLYWLRISGNGFSGMEKVVVLK